MAKDKKQQSIKQSMGAKKIIVYSLIGVLAIAVLLGLWAVSKYNSFVSFNQEIDSKWADVETQYQRRADLIPNLVETTKGYVNYESKLLTDVTAARTQWQNAKTNDEKIDAATGLDSVISRLLVVYENYPNLKGVEQFNRLQDELAGTENRVAVARQRYNDAVRQYNTATKTFPSSIIARSYGFSERKYFEAEKGAESAPKVKF